MGGLGNLSFLIYWVFVQNFPGMKMENIQFYLI